MFCEIIRNKIYSETKLYISGNDYNNFRNKYGDNNDIPERLLGMSYDEFLEKYPHLRSDTHAYVLSDVRFLNIDMFADVDSDMSLSYNNYFNEDGVREFFEIVKIICEKTDCKEQ